MPWSVSSAVTRNWSRQARVSPRSSATSGTERRSRRRSRVATASSTSRRRWASSATGRTTGRSTSTALVRWSTPRWSGVSGAWCTSRHRRSPMAANRSSAGRRTRPCSAVVEPGIPSRRRWPRWLRSPRHRTGWVWWRSDRTSCGGPATPSSSGRIVERARAGRLALVGGGRALVDTTYIDNAVAALVAALDAVDTGCPVLRSCLRRVERGAADDP